MKFLHPFDLYERLFQLKKKAIGLDLGEFSTGLCLCEPPSSFPKICPILAPENWEGKYSLSPLEKILNESNDGRGNYRQGWFYPKLPFSPQVLNATTMAVSEMRDVLNYLADVHKVEYFIFGFNAHSDYWDDKENYAFIRKQLKDLEEDGKLRTIYFTFVDESGSTKVASKFFGKKFPELENTELFLKRNYLFKDRIVNNPRYQDDGENLKKDLSKHHKRMLDCYAACIFCWGFFDKCVKGNLMDGGFQSQKISVMMNYAISFGYKVEQPRYPRPYDPPIPPEHIAASSSSG
ncbi:hypothetical protein Q3G72_012160 [Acer saccharum]|nr:hypothetical protein Q3G72_012160 [Acer saccharum]